MKLVLDSSVLIAASISRAGVCAELLEDVLTYHELVISDFIVDEVAGKLREKLKFPEGEIEQLRRLLRRAAATVEPTEIPADICRDRNDIPILGTAVAGRAEFLITVDKDLLSLGTYKGIDIIKPAEFWRRTTG